MISHKFSNDFAVPFMLYWYTPSCLACLNIIRLPQIYTFSISKLSACVKSITTILWDVVVTQRPLQRKLTTKTIDDVLIYRSSFSNQIHDRRLSNKSRLSSERQSGFSNKIYYILGVEYKCGSK